MGGVFPGSISWGRTLCTSPRGPALAKGASELYIGFRYRGKLQSIHHIESAEVFTDPHSKFPGIPDRKWEPHFLYCLGPKFAPSHDVPMGKLYPNGRNSCWMFNFAHPLAWLIVALIVLIPAGIAIVATKMAGK
jgi:hypothetical protein